MKPKHVEEVPLSYGAKFTRQKNARAYLMDALWFKGPGNHKQIDIMRSMEKRFGQKQLRVDIGEDWFYQCRWQASELRRAGLIKPVAESGRGYWAAT